MFLTPKKPPLIGLDISSTSVKMLELGKTGIYNMGGAELLSRYEFTLKIAEYFELDTSLIKNIVTSDLNQVAQRPLNSGLINLKAESELNYKPRNIEHALRLMHRYLDV